MAKSGLNQRLNLPQKEQVQLVVADMDGTLLNAELDILPSVNEGDS